ncbi:MAG: RNA-binding S4 domain-containing protein [Telluria sp.]|jgi:ribosome-associated heat shock protein Hsp15
MDNVRIDKWLWAARFFKTRSLATDAVDNGKVRLGGERIKPARAVKLDDLLTIDNGAENWEVTVLGISDKRGAAPVARLLYAETEASITRRANEAEGRKLYREPGSMIKGRPTKHDRRALSKVSE